MAKDFNYDIDINFRTNTSQTQKDITNITKLIEQLSNKVNTVGVKINTSSFKRLQKEITSTTELSEVLSRSIKNRQTLENKRLDALSDGNIEKVAKINAVLEKQEITLRQLVLFAQDYVNKLQQQKLQAQQTRLTLVKTRNDMLQMGDGSALSGMLLKPKPNDVSITQKLANAWQVINKSLSKTVALISKTAKETKKTSNWATKLMGRIRNISIYRMIRTGIRWFTSGITEGLQGLSQYNSEIDKTVSNIKNSLNQIRNTLAISMSYILKSLEPLITSLTDSIVNLVNAFNLAMAKGQGEKYYLKAKKAADLYSKSAEKARKLSFDTFEVLSGGDNKTPTKDLFEETEIEKDENQMSKLFEKIIELANVLWNAIKEIGKAIGEIIVDLQENGVFEFIASTIITIVNGIRDVIKFMNKLGLLKPVLLAIAAAWVAVKVAAIGAALANAAAFLFAHPFIGVPVLIAASAALVGIGSQLMSSVIGKLQDGISLNGFENGGIPNKSELFYMNENGVPEALVNTGGSQTNVINIDQLSEGMRRGFIQAIYDTDLVGAIREQGGTTLMVDKDVLGSTVASSAGFRNEMNRRNANLNLIFLILTSNIFCLNFYNLLPQLNAQVLYFQNHLNRQSFVRLLKFYRVHEQKGS